MKSEDSGLLQSYAAEGAEDAFTQLVRRHLDLVWATAHRITGEAAQKRLTRSLERLRKYFASRGTTLSATAVTALLTAAGAKAAPAGLALSVSSVLLAAAAISRNPSKSLSSELFRFPITIRIGRRFTP